MAFRGSLEVTEDRRAAELAERLPPWLAAIGCDEELDPVEREELRTPLGQLSPSQRIDLNIADYAAAFLAWTLGRHPLPSWESRPEQRLLFQALPVLRGEARAVLLGPALRDTRELEEVACEYSLLRTALQQARLPPAAREVLGRIALQRLAEAGINAHQVAVAKAEEIVAGLSDEERQRRAGLCFVLEHAALWLFNTRSSYFE
jgi:hypothetical protein